MPSPRLLSLIWLLAATACSAPQSAVTVDETGPLEFLHERVGSLHVDDDGDAWIGFGQLARGFVILRDQPELLAFAREAMANSTLVHATVRTGHGDKAAEAGRPVDAAGKRRVAVVRLAASPDPRQPR